MSQSFPGGFKLILLGESSVGKTSLIKRLTINEYSDISVSTVGHIFTEKILEIKDMKIRFEIWDTAGQEKFRSLINNYYNGCDGVILVYDITNRKSYDELVNYWYKEILAHCPDIGKLYKT